MQYARTFAAEHSRARSSLHNESGSRSARSLRITWVGLLATAIIIVLTCIVFAWGLLSQERVLGRTSSVSRIFGVENCEVVTVQQSTPRQRRLTGAVEKLAQARAAAFGPLPKPWEAAHPLLDFRDRLPTDFNWRAYLANYPELPGLGVTTRAQAETYFLLHGRRAGHVYWRLRVFLRHTVEGGLVNQHYGHIAAIALAAASGAELFLPPSVSRNSFALGWFNENLTWVPRPTDHLLDVDGLIAYWQKRRIFLHKTPALSRIQKRHLRHPHAYYDQIEMHPGLTARFNGRPLNYDLDQLVDALRITAVGHAEKLLRQDVRSPRHLVPYVCVDWPYSIFSLKLASAPKLAAEVISSMNFPPSIIEIADKVVARINGSYNSLHLRIEADAVEHWVGKMGGAEVVWTAYLKAMKSTGFVQSRPLYLASSLLAYSAELELDKAVSRLKKAGLCSEVIWKEKYLTNHDLEGLASSEQRGLIDFLVLAHGHRFVGAGFSSFSYLLPVFRFVEYDIPFSSSTLINLDQDFLGTQMGINLRINHD